MLVPTRELAEQVCTVLGDLLGGQRDRVLAVYGGTGYEGQRKALRRGVDVVVACPGRLEDLLARRDMYLDHVSIVVLDEADRMVDMGFLPPVRRLLDLTADGRQVLLFSATIGPEIEAISRRYQKDPVRHDVISDDEDRSAVTHLFWSVERTERVAVTARLAAEHGQLLVFCRTKRGADRTAKQLRAAGIEAAPIHGDRTQNQRTGALDAFSAGRTQVLVATDVMARGIHVDELPCVVHFDHAPDANTYVHRSGRTGRVGRSGTVISLVGAEHRKEVRAVQKSLGFPSVFGPPVIGPPRPTARRAPAPAKAVRAGAQKKADAPRRSEGPRRPEGKHPAKHRGAGGARQATGIVKFYDATRGYGFLSRAGGGDVFVHHSRLEGGTGPAGLRKGQQVSFEVASGSRGDEAHNVKAV